MLVDADVVIGALDATDAHHAAARERFEGWSAAGTPRAIALLTLTEVLIGPSADSRTLATAREAIAALGLVVQSPTEAIAVDAARLRHGHPISVPDAFLLAAARRFGAAISTFDRRLVRAADREAVSTC